MTPQERTELRRLLTATSNVAQQRVRQRTAELLAQVEEQLAARYDFGDAAWADLTTEAQRVVQEADRALAERSRHLGIPEAFRPSLSLSWWNRGENAVKERQAELRRAAAKRIDALARKARATIDAKVLDGLTRLAQSALTSGEARAFLAALPTVEALMPPMNLAALDPATPQKAPELPDPSGAPS